jgi:NADH:ubiquinone oxidoreductase subunit 4 (subunit M)
VSFYFLIYFFLIILEGSFSLGKRNFEILANILILIGLVERFFLDCDCVTNIYHFVAGRGDYISKWFVFLNFFTWLIRNLTASFVNHSLSKYTLYIILMLINFFIWIMLNTNRIIIFYTYFELRVIPIFLLIGAWGYNPERDVAGVLYLFLSVVFARPLILIFVGRTLSHSDLTFHSIIIRLETPYYQFSRLRFYFIFITLPWMIKIPLLYFHVWLIKAHVEAPIYGSVELAGILIKVSVVGAHRFVFCFQHCYSILESLKALCLARFLVARSAAFFIGDFKLIVAISSVSHVCIPFFCLVSLKYFPLLRCIFYLIGHRFSTISLFIRGQIFYQRLGSRIVKMITGSLNDLVFAGLFFRSVICRLGVPPTIGFLIEVFLCFFSIRISFIVIFFLFLGLFCVAIYSLSLFTSRLTKDILLEKIAVFKIRFFLRNIIFLNIWVFFFTNLMLWNFN